jgi:hypothetical protein
LISIIIRNRIINISINISNQCNFLTFLGCNDKDKNGLDFADCLSNDSKGTVSSFTDFRGNLTAPNPKGYAAGLTQATDARTFILNIVNFALGFLGLIAVLVVIYGGFTMVTSMGAVAVFPRGRH